MTTGPLPTTLISLTDLPSSPAGSKVRFLGCVAKYTISTGMLNLQNTYRSVSSQGSAVVTAIVDVNLLLSTLKMTDLQGGEWVNVIGYVDGESGSRKESDVNGRQKGEFKEVKIQAVMVWSAGAIRLGDYEKAIAARIDTSLKMP